MTTKMIRSIKRKWVKALRSGKYFQGAGQLCNRNARGKGKHTHCCLGVLHKEVTGKNDFKREMPSPEFRNACRLTAVGLLVEMNDVRERSFLDIADWIDKNL